MFRAYLELESEFVFALLYFGRVRNSRHSRADYRYGVHTYRQALASLSFEFFGCLVGAVSKSRAIQIMYRGSPDSTNFGPPGDRTIAKIVLSGD